MRTVYLGVSQWLSMYRLYASRRCSPVDACLWSRTNIRANGFRVGRLGEFVQFILSGLGNKIRREPVPHLRDVAVLRGRSVGVYHRDQVRLARNVRVGSEPDGRLAFGFCA